VYASESFINKTFVYRHSPRNLMFTCWKAYQTMKWLLHSENMQNGHSKTSLSFSLVEHRVFLLLQHQARQLYRTERLYPPGQPSIAYVLRTAIAERHYTLYRILSLIISPFLYHDTCSNMCIPFAAMAVHYQLTKVIIINITVDSKAQSFIFIINYVLNS
jgi:hypothetical protein